MWLHLLRPQGVEFRFIEGLCLSAELVLGYEGDCQGSLARQTLLRHLCACIKFPVSVLGQLAQPKRLACKRQKPGGLCN